MLLGDDIDDTSHRITTIKGALRSLNDFYLLDIMGIDETQIVFSTHIAMNTFAVNEYQDIAVAQAVQLHLTAHITLVECKRCCQSAQNFFKAFAAIAVKHTTRDDLRLYRGVLQ